MGLLDEFREASKTPRMPCTVAVVRSALDDERAEALDEALTDPSIAGTGIAKVLTGWGHKISGPSVQRHRRGACSCGS